MPTKLPRFRTAADGIAARVRALLGDTLSEGAKRRTAAALEAAVRLPMRAPAAVIAHDVGDARNRWDWAEGLYATSAARARLHDTFRAMMVAARVHPLHLPTGAGQPCSLIARAFDLLTTCTSPAHGPAEAEAALRAGLGQLHELYVDARLATVPADERAYFPPPEFGPYLGAAFGSDMYVPREFVSSTARHLAEVIYREETWTVLPILADALQDQGAPDGAEYLKYLRGPGPFFRGCLAVDSCRGVP